MKDLVVLLRPIIYLPGDKICRKNDIGKEMFIIQSGQVRKQIIPKKNVITVIRYNFRFKFLVALRAIQSFAPLAKVLSSVRSLCWAWVG